MDFKKACSILSLSPDFSHTELKRKYYKEALKHHPDKHGSTEKFQELNEAYTFLLHHHNLVDHSPNKMMDIIQELLKSTSLYEALEKIHPDIFHHIYDLLPLIQSLIPKEQYDIIQTFISNKFTYIILEPTLDDLFQQKIFVYKQDNNTYHIPLWSHEIIFGNYIFKCIPKLPENIEIDDSNNIIITLYESIQHIFLKDEISILQYNIKVSDLFIKKNQTIILRNKGIPIINPENIFFIQLSNVIIHINLSC